MDCSCDYESPEFYNTRDVTARKDHKCSECGSVIIKGEKYNNTTGKWNGDISTYKACSDCLSLRYALETTNCYCLMHGCIVDDFCESIDDCWKFSYSMKNMKHRRKWIEDNIKETFENWEECRDGI